MALFDAIDGALARLGERTSRFGAFLDSTLDRFSEAVVYLGLFIYFIGQDVPLALVLIYVTVVGSLLDGVQLMAKKATEAYLAGQKGRSDWGELPAVEIAKDRFQILTGWQG